MSAEPSLRFRCFGGEASLHLGGPGPSETALIQGRDRLLEVHRRLSRFLPESELSRINGSPLAAVPASPLARRFTSAAVDAARRSGGLVDPTLVGEIERAGYGSSLEGTRSLPLAQALRLAPSPRPASPNPRATWRAISVDDAAEAIRRPPGLRLDSGGVAKGLSADLLAATLGGWETYAVDCGGDIRIGGRAGLPRSVEVDDPFGGDPIHTYEVRQGAVATSGIGRRAWLTPDGEPAHHLLDPATGRPAYTGVVQVTALAPTAWLAEVLAKTALLRGPQGSASALPFGGCVVFDDGSIDLVAGAPLSSAVTQPPTASRA